MDETDQSQDLTQRRQAARGRADWVFLFLERPTALPKQVETELAESEKIYMRDAAYMVAINRVVRAMEIRGWI